MNDPTWAEPPRAVRPPAAPGTVYRSRTAASTVDRASRRPMLGRLALVVLLVVSTSAAILVGYHLTTVAAHAGARTANGAGSAMPSASGQASPTTRAPGTPEAGIPKAGTATPDPLLAPGRVTANVDGFLSWALMNRQTGTVTGSANHATASSTTESMIKIWIAGDYLRRQAATGHRPGQQRLDELTRMIRDSDDQAAEDIYRLDGGDDVVNRMISICGLPDTTMVDGWWSKTEITARDATRLGLCVADGRAAGSAWTPWILAQMRQVRGQGRFGIIDALPGSLADTTAIKNGWTLINDDGNWHVACLAVQDRWILAVLTRYDASRGLAYGATVCADVTRQLMAGP